MVSIGIGVLIPLTPYIAGATISVVAGCTLAYLAFDYNWRKGKQLEEYEGYLNQIKEEMKTFTENKNKQINNIYEILEALTNESKAKTILQHYNSNVSEQKDEQ